MAQPIAIIGAACRFPGGASSPSKLWDLLHEPRDLDTKIPPDRLNLSRFYNPNGEHHGATDVQGHAYLLSEDCRLFDASFFKISPKEAEGMDPQQRILLETVYEAFETAGYRLEDVSGSQTSVHVGAMNADYSDIQLRDPEAMLSHHATGTTRSILSNRISYFFNLKGASVTTDTACSSSLVALHQAVQGLRNGDASTAVVAGANLILDSSMYIAESKLHMLSADSRCRMWDKDANGYARGEGFAAVILKTLAQALADDDLIEGIVREICVNSDGRSPKGITNPSFSAQANLIRQTYHKAGLDPVADRCQFFECHGTGTLAGDPVEAQAIREAFFPQGSSTSAPQPPTSQLYVGSIKTVIGHTEGCAGLAGVLKALLAIKHRTIPPNLHFNELNPDISPFYENLTIPTKALPWPSPEDLPLRVSVNSFGFGGTNAHCLVESFCPVKPQKSLPQSSGDSSFIGPLVFSANSNTSLVASVANFRDHIRCHPHLDLEDAGWTLQKSRSVFPCRTFFSGSNKDRLLHFMDRFVSNPSASGSTVTEAQKRPQTPHEEPGILGVFTGQGAQWASMGKGLVETSPIFRECIEACEAVLAALSDPPAWSLMAELMAEEPVSRVSEAAIAQPLCTAVQLGLLSILQRASIRLHAVVGHSSGEIAAACAAGIISEAAAMQISYYRGLHASTLACGAHGKSGKMMAVGMSHSDACLFLSKAAFQDRIVVAASNSPASVTLSGDEDAIEEAKALLDQDKVFARILHTHTAYHSHHMDPCSIPYLQSLRACRINILPAREDCTWISSVYGDPYPDDFSELRDQYWVDNMRNPVLFSQAIESSIWNGGPFDMVLEIGPHPALKGPTEQTLKSALGYAPAYAGLMRRGDSEVEALSGAVGFLWSLLGPNHVNFSAYRSAFSLPKATTVKDLPTYAWDHRQEFWKESRISRRYRLQQDYAHELLGRRMADDSDDSPRWRNFLRNEEIAWLRQHVFQGQILFPGAAYVVMALEAARQMAGDRPITLYQLESVELKRAIVIPDNSAGVELVFSCSIIEHLGSKETLVADFSCLSCSDEAGRLGLVTTCTGRIRLVFGQPSDSSLPPRQASAPDMVPVDVGRFYTAMAKVGLDYQGLFCQMKGACRSLGSAAVSASWNGSDVGSEYLIHPGLLDVAFQSLYVAFSSPASGQIWAPYLPVQIKRLSLNAAADFTAPNSVVDMEMDAFVETATSTRLAGDISIYAGNSAGALLQVEGIVMQAVSEPSPENDKLLFSSTVWTKDIASGLTNGNTEPRMQDDHDLVEALDRTSLFYWQRLITTLTPDELETCKHHHRLMVNVANAAIHATRDGMHPVTKPEWLDDSEMKIDAISRPYEDRADMRLIHAVGQNLYSVLTSDTQLLEVMLQDDLLNRFYLEGYGFSHINTAISETVKQISTKYPQAKLLEVGAGTGGTTRSVLASIGCKYASYTFTDVSTGFFTKAADTFAEYSNSMTFKVLDIEKDVSAQGFEYHCYDIVIASNVLHATRCLNETMRNVRSLLKPGGYLILMEITGLQILRTQFIMGGLPGWWYGAPEGRRMSPAISEMDWDELLRDTGFSGVDHIMHDMQDESRHSFSLMVSQAIDETLERLREPLLHLDDLEVPQNLAVFGGKTLSGSRLVNEIRKLLKPWNHRTKIIKDLDALHSDSLGPRSSVLFLQELEQPLFVNGVTERKLSALKSIFASARKLLWVTSGRRSASPESNMMVGVGRALATEIPDLCLQFVDLDGSRNVVNDARGIVHAFLRLQITSDRESKDPDRLLVAEPEINIVDDEVWIPRVQPHERLNCVYNASRRFIGLQVSAREHCLEMRSCDAGLELALDPTVATAGKQQPGSATLQVMYTMLLAASESVAMYLSIGTEQASGQLALALSSRNMSILHLPGDRLVNIDHPEPVSPRLLWNVGFNFIALQLLDWLPKQGTIVIHEASEPLLMAITSVARPPKQNLFFTTFRNGSSTERYCVIHPASTERSLKRQLPHDVNAFVDFSKSTGSRLVSLLPFSTLVLTTQDLVNLLESDVQLRSVTEQKQLQLSGCQDLLVVRAQEASSRPLMALAPHTITDWTSPDVLTIRTPTLDTTKLLSPASTYLLVGMTGEMGLSLSRWMVKSGARHIALASRKPAVNRAWIEDMERQGVNVQVFSADVADEESVRSLLAKLRSSMPRIAGVCNASMVLSDKLFLDMDVQSMETCLRPKVEGSRILNEAFGNEPLDFFILLSSLASIIGNAGQSNYHAANLFMSSLVARRRQQGLAGSVLHIGLVTDIGYVAKTGVAMEERLRRLFFMPLSESDLHHSFAQAILGGEAGSRHENDLIVGLEPFSKSALADVRPPWEGNPRMSHYVRIEASREHQSNVRVGSTNLRQEVEDAGTEDASTKVVEACFSRKLEAMMQLPSGSVNVNVPLLDLGCDSLLAIEIRGWFSKELQVDLPVLKVLSGDTVAELCAEATKRFLASRLNPPGLSQSPKAANVKIYDERARLETPPGSLAGAQAETPPSEAGSESLSIPSMTSHFADSSFELSTGLSSTADTSLTDVTTSLETFDASNSSSPPLIYEQHPASYAQSRLWFLTKYLADRTTYNVTVAYGIHGPLNVAQLRLALASVYRRHSSLRTMFFEDEKGSLMQGILAAPSWTPKFLENGDESAVHREYAALKNTVWDLEHGRAFGATIVELPDHHVLIFGYHHIVLDGVSWHIFLKDLDSIYQTRQLPACVDYSDYSKALLRATEIGSFEEDIEFWRKEHADLPQVMPLLPMASVTKRETLRHFESHVVSRRLESHVVSAIKQAGQKLRATPFHFHLAIVQIIFAHLLDQSRLCIGVADANRTDDRYAGTVGFFLNLLPMKFEVYQDISFAELVRRTSQKALASLSHSSVPFDHILDALKVPRSPSHSPLFQVVVNYRMGDVLQRPLGNCDLLLSSADDARNPYDLTFGITDQSNGTCLLEITAQKQLYTEMAAESLMTLYIHLLEHLSLDVNISIQDCTISQPLAVQEAIELGRGPRVQFDWPSTLSQRFLDMAVKYASGTAIQDETGKMTYAELKTKVNAIVHAIYASDAKPGTPVAVLCRPSHLSIASMLAILISGLVYLPLDPRLPRARQIIMVQSCGAGLLLHQSDTDHAASELRNNFKFAFGAVNVECLPQSPIATELRDSAVPDQPAFILYTSGTTGVPKGIVLSQANFRNHLAVKTHDLGIKRETVLQQSSLSFDMSIVQSFCALANGGTLVVASSKTRGDPVELSKLMLAADITFTIATPSEYHIMLCHGRESLSRCSSWHQACMGGEMVTRELLRDFETLVAPKMKLINCYGPTEITAAATFEKISLESFDEKLCHEHSLVGKTLANYSVYIINEHGHAMPAGMIGEICIAGAGVALGYIRQDKLTCTSFPLDPHASPDDKAKGWNRMYRTGDKGRFSEDGKLIFMGRMDGDDQVKLHGQRIELNEVANQLRHAASGRIVDAVASVRGEPSFLVAHAVFAPGVSLSSAELTELTNNLPLPHYMIPSVIIPLETLPITVNGKVDRKAIAEIPMPDAQAKPSQAQRLTLAEGELRLLWQKILPQTSSIGSDSDFFILGGNSMMLVRLQAAIRQDSGVHVPIIDLYAASTLGRMAARISTGKREELSSHEQIDWVLETSPPQGTASAAELGKPRASGRSTLQIVHTGSTSFVGMAVLTALLQRSEVGIVHCVAVPAEEKGRLASLEKVKVYVGTLAHPTLGLSEAEQAVLRENADVVLHAGSEGHCLNRYSSLRLPNVHSTRFLATLAVSGEIPIHYLSSSRVTLLSGSTDLPPESVATSFPPIDGSEGFTASKWASERTLELLSHETGLRVTIHRSCAPVGSRAPSEDALNALLKFAMSMRAVPRFDNFEGYFDFKDVNAIAKDIVQEILRPAGDVAEPVRFVHHSSGRRLPVARLRTHMHDVHEIDCEELSIDAWIERATAAGIDPLIAGYLEAIVQKEEKIRFPYLGS